SERPHNQGQGGQVGKERPIEGGTEVCRKVVLLVQRFEKFDNRGMALFVGGAPIERAGGEVIDNIPRGPVPILGNKAQFGMHLWMRHQGSSYFNPQLFMD